MNENRREDLTHFQLPPTMNFRPIETRTIEKSKKTTRSWSSQTLPSDSIWPQSKRAMSSSLYKIKKENRDADWALLFFVTILPLIQQIRSWDNNLLIMIGRMMIKSTMGYNWKYFLDGEDNTGNSSLLFCGPAKGKWAWIRWTGCWF